MKVSRAMLPHTVTTIAALLALAAAQQPEDSDKLSTCRGGSGFPVLIAGGNDTLILGPNANMSCSQVQFYLNGEPQPPVALQGGDTACQTQPMLQIAVPNIDYAGDVKMTLICDTEYDVPCYKLSMITKSTRIPHPKSVPSKGVFSVSQLCGGAKSSSWNSSSSTYISTSISTISTVLKKPPAAGSVAVINGTTRSYTSDAGGKNAPATGTSNGAMATAIAGASDASAPAVSATANGAATITTAASGGPDTTVAESSRAAVTSTSTITSGGAADTQRETSTESKVPCTCAQN